MKNNLCTRICSYFRLRRELKQLSKDSCFSFKQIKFILKSYRSAFLEFSKTNTYLINKLEFNESEIHKQITFQYLIERIIVSPFHVLNLVERDPFLAHTDAAAINRGLFEAAVNYLYLLDDDDLSKFSRFHIGSVRQELNIQKAAEKWSDNNDEGISAISKQQKDIKDKTTNALLEEVKAIYGLSGQMVKKYPTIRDRCMSVGERWAHLYDAKYKGLSAWQHGDFSRAFVSSSFQQRNVGTKDRPLFETLGMLVWAYDVAHRFTQDFAIHIKDPEALNHIHNVSRITDMKIYPELNKIIKLYQHAT